MCVFHVISQFSGRLPYALALILTCTLFSSSHAQESAIPTYIVLRCEIGCGQWVDPKPIGEHHGFVPETMRNDPKYTSDTYVAIRFTIAPDGTVKKPVVEKLIGQPKFAEYSLEALRGWRYEPATINGVAVQRTNWAAELTYSFLLGDPPKWVYGDYDKARSLVAEQKYAEANTILLPILSAPRLYFEERSIVSLSLAISYTGLKDYLTAREYIEDATLEKGKFLRGTTREAAIRQRIRLDAGTGQYADAFAWFELLNKQAKIASDDSDAKLIDKLHARLADPQPLFVTGRIPVSGYMSLWHHTLLRRSFAFPKTDGKVDRFDLRCDQQEIESTITNKAEWHVPKDWSNCELEVFGGAGATFQLVEVDD